VNAFAFISPIKEESHQLQLEGGEKMKMNEISEQAIVFILTRNNDELKNLTEVEIANNIGVDSFLLSNRFKKDQKISLPDFILREKLYRAYFILRKNDEKSVDELSRELGFSNVDDFDSEFEKFFAISPNVYKEIRKNPRLYMQT
jgi:AraC-like DNA-binding protein